MIGEISPRQLFECVPVATFRNLHAALFGHLQEEQICELLDIVAVVHAVMAERVAEAPKFLDNIAHAAIASFISCIKAGKRPLKILAARPHPPKSLKIG